jgi:hypothetical protein
MLLSENHSYISFSPSLHQTSMWHNGHNDGSIAASCELQQYYYL